MRDLSSCKAQEKDRVNGPLGPAAIPTFIAGQGIFVASAKRAKKEGAVHKGPPQHLRSGPKAATSTLQGGCSAGWNQVLPAKPVVLTFQPVATHRFGLDRGGSERRGLGSMPGSYRTGKQYTTQGPEEARNGKCCPKPNWRSSMPP